MFAASGAVTCAPALPHYGSVALPTAQGGLPISFFLAAARRNCWRRQEGNHSVQWNPWADTKEQENYVFLFFFSFFNYLLLPPPPKKPSQAPGNRFFSVSCIQNIINCNQVMKHVLLGGDTLRKLKYFYILPHFELMLNSGSGQQ